MGVESKVELSRLRRQASQLGIAIRTQPGSGAPGVRDYSLVDRDTGRVIYADIRGLVEVQERLWWIIRDRKRAPSLPAGVTQTSEELCPSCGARRIGQFRWCLGCGLDYEASTKLAIDAESGRQSSVPGPLTSPYVREGFATELRARARDAEKARLASAPEIDPPSAPVKLGRRVRPAQVILALLIVSAITVGLALSARTRPPTPAAGSGSPDAATGWFGFNGATIQRVPSGDTSAKYASGVTASTGGFFARLRKDPTPGSCTEGQTTAPVYSGPYTNWGGGHSPTFPPGGFTTAVDIYLDVDHAIANPDARFDWSSAISDTNGNKLRDFVFNVGTDATGFVMTTGTTATRCASNPSDPAPDHSPVIHIAQSGWYTFKHIFAGTAGGPLTVTQTVASTTSLDIPLGSWTHSDPAVRIGTQAGGINEGSFVQNEFDGLAIDNAMVGTVGDLGVEVTGSPEPAHVDRTLTYTVEVANHGPAAATDVAIVGTLPDGTGFGSVTAKDGTCTRSNLVVNCKIGMIASGDRSTLTIVVKPSRTGSITMTAAVSAFALSDLNATNDTFAQSTTVLP